MTSPAPLAERPPSGLLTLFRTTAFKLSIAYLAVFAACAAAALGTIAWSARQVLDDQIVSTIDAEINGLAEQYNAGGLRRLIAAVERRAREPGASLYLVTTANGEHVVGNVGDVPAAVLATPGLAETLYGRSRETDGREDRRAIVRIFTLPGGFRLLVGRDVEERDRLRGVIGRTFGTSLALVVLLGVVGGWVVAGRVLKRVDAMTGTARTIMAGDLDGRLPVAGNGDELDRLAQSLNLMLERIGELMRGMREVSDNIAHDLKTPLTRLRNRADAALSADAAPDTLRGALEGVIDESDGLIRVFNALLTIARLEAGASESRAPFDLGPSVRGVGELYEALAEARGLHFAVSAPDGLVVDGNRELIGQALANLIDNAIKYAADAPAGAAIAVEALRQGPDIVLSVADGGPGIPAAERERVLDRFVRLEDARSRPGFGLGLSLVNAVVRLHQGGLTLQDNAPGLRVIVRLPAALPDRGT